MALIVFMVGLMVLGMSAFELQHPTGVWILGIGHKPLFWVFWVALLTIASLIKFVRQQDVLVIERLGRYNRTLTAGINYVWPLVERVAYIFDLREQVVDVPKQEAITKDNATIIIDGILYFKIVNGKDAAYGAQDIRRAIVNLAQTTMRSAIGSMELDKTFENRAEINQKVVKAVGEAAQTWGALVTRYEIKDIQMPASLKDSMERQMKAERDKRAAILNSEGEKQSAINKADGDKQAKILRADGEKAAAIATAEGQARAIELVREQITQVGGDQAVQLEVAKDALEQYGHLAKAGNSLVFMGESADPAGWLAKAMSVLKVAGAQTLPGKSSTPPSK